jgi:FtsP/CotA-like multicopper oxidase with cupredoxin domain
VGGALVPDYFGTTPNWGFSPPIQKFVDALPDLTSIIATADTTSFPGSDYYEIELVEYSTWQFNADLPATPKLRGYRQTNVAGTLPEPSYMGPTIVATRDRPTRIKFTNNLPTGASGKLFIPTDTTVMGAGPGYDPIGGGTSSYAQNRGTLHLHGGFTPWVSDGTPHQWVTPANEPGPLKTGVSTEPVPDMNIPAGNSMTFYWPNQQSGRLMFYHDHAYGITRLNVYAGEAAGYLLRDSAEEDALAGLGVPGTIGTSSTTTDLAHLVPLVIQDKTFVWGTPPATCGSATPGTGTFFTDPTWCDPVHSWGQGPGSLWFPHVYMPGQNPWDMTGSNAMGRWDYALWFWPPYTGLLKNDALPNPYYGPAAPWEPPLMPGMPSPSLVPEAFMDTPIVNGKAYPTMTVDPQKYRFRILNAANDRFFNLSLFVAADKNSPTTAGTTGTVLCNGSVPTIPSDCTEVKMVPFNTSQHLITPFPSKWYTSGIPYLFDDRAGGVPDPTTRGPAMIQIGSEGGLLPAPAVILNQPINYTLNRRNIVVLSVEQHALLLGSAERADVIIDFSKFAGSTLILYNDAPAPVPAGDPRLDYFTGGPDYTATGGAPPTVAGYGPNIRTVMQFVVTGSGGTAPVDDVDSAFLSTLSAANGMPAIFALTQDPIIVPQQAYKLAYPSITYTADVPGVNLSRISDTALTFKPVGSTTDITFNMAPKAVQELFELEYGRMNSTLGVEVPFTNAANQTTIPYNYIDPVTEFLDSSATIAAPTLGDGTQIWKITHNGVDTHAVHFHLFNVQVVNRVGWDGSIRRPDANELGWKETVRMNPLEDIIVAMRPTTPKLPFGLPDSYRLLDVTSAPGTTGQFTNIDANGNPLVVTNAVANFGWEYVWHCHLLGHEENDMMRPMVFNTLRALPHTPTGVRYSKTGGIVTLTWTDGTPFNYATGLPLTTLGNPANEIGFRFERAPVSNSGVVGTYVQLLNPDLSVASARANRTTWTALGTEPSGIWSYRVVSYNAAGVGASAGVLSAVPLGPAAPTGMQAKLIAGPQVLLTWVNNATNATSIVIERQTGTGTFTTLATIAINLASYVDSTATAGQTYTYRVKAVNASGSSSYSTSGAVAVLVPSAPSQLTAGAVLVGRTTDAVSLRWTNNSTNERSFTLQRCAGNNATCSRGGATWANVATTIPATATAYTVTAVAKGTVFTYRLSAVNFAGSSPWSNLVTVIFP